nr:ATPase, F1/V1/A1 complex, alpha/beta subunit, zinc knuckle CX2CX4HX4C [Tanacetum cinerariifolium]
MGYNKRVLGARGKVLIGYEGVVWLAFGRVRDRARVVVIVMILVDEETLEVIFDMSEEELGWHLEEIHVTWAHLEKKRTRLRLYTIYLEELCIHSVETASRTSSDGGFFLGKKGIGVAANADMAGGYVFNSNPMDSYGMPATRVNLVESGVTCDGSPKVSNSFPFVSPTTINVPRELYNIDVAATFGVPLTTVGDLHKLIKDIKVGKHDELLFGMTNDDRMETMYALGTICNSIQADNNNADVIPCKVLHVDDSSNLNVDESRRPNDPIVQSVDINTKSTSYARAAGVSAHDQPKVNSNFRTLVADLVFDGIKISIPRKVIKRNNWAKHGLKRIMMNSKGFFFFNFNSRASLEDVLEGGPWSSFARCLIEVNSEADLKDVVTIGIPSLSGDGFTKETIHVEYEPKATTSAPRVTNVRNTSQSSSMLKTTGNSSKKDNLSMSNSFSALNDEEEDEEEDVENVYNESSNLIQNTKATGSSSFMAAAG